MSAGLPGHPRNSRSAIDRGTMKQMYSARMHGISGAQRDLIERLADPEINDLEDCEQFRENYPILREKMIIASLGRVRAHLSDLGTTLGEARLEREQALKSKTDELHSTLRRLEDEQAQPPRRRPFPAGVVEGVKAWVRRRKVQWIRNGFQAILVRSTKKQTKFIVRMESEISRIRENLQEIAEEQIASDLRRIDETNARLEEEKLLYYGALGERDVIQKLGSLPAAYHVLNDYRNEFGRPIYNRAEDDRIFSVQIDHIVVGPTGVFVIETKNWSPESLASDAHFSPIKQVRRAGFALFVLLNQAMKDGEVRRASTGWGDRKISIKTAVVFRGKVPQGQYEFVRILGIERLNAYLTSGRHEFCAEEIESIVSYLLSTGTSSRPAYGGTRWRRRFTAARGTSWWSRRTSGSWPRRGRWPKRIGFGRRPSGRSWR